MDLKTSFMGFSLSSSIVVAASTGATQRIGYLKMMNEGLKEWMKRRGF